MDKGGAAILVAAVVLALEAVWAAESKCVGCSGWRVLARPCWP